MTRTFLIMGAAALAGVVWGLAVSWWRWRRRQPRSEIAPAHVLQRRYGLYAENRPVIRLDRARVPEHLRDLIPLAEKWGIGDDIIRFDFMEKSTAAEKDELLRVVGPRFHEVEAWLATAEPGDLSEEISAFTYLTTAWDELRAGMDADE
jgi:hypothetical protein